MTIHLPNNLEHSVQALVRGGRFTSLDEAIAEGVRLLLKNELPDTTSDLDDPNDKPIVLMGEPLSERTIRERQATAEKAAVPIWDVIDRLSAAVPPEDLARLPEDGARQMDHYLYGSPKRPIS